MKKNKVLIIIAIGVIIYLAINQDNKTTVKNVWQGIGGGVDLPPVNKASLNSKQIFDKSQIPVNT